MINKTQITFDTYLKYYLEEREFRVSKVTLRSDKTRVKNIKSLFSNKNLVDVSHSDVMQIILKMQCKRYSNKTINEHLSPLRAVFNRAKRDGNIDINPMDGVENLKYSYKEPRPFNQQEIEKIQQTYTSSKSEKNAILLCLLTGLRIGELLALAHKDINLEKRELYVRRSIILGEYKQPKTAKLQVVTIALIMRQWTITMKTLKLQKMMRFKPKGILSILVSYSLT